MPMPENGVWKSHYDNGQLRSEWTLAGGVEEGLSREWHENGQLMSEGHMKNGLEHGLWTRWYDNGQKESEVVFEEGIEQGPVIFWYRNGQKPSELETVDGRLEGRANGWYESGARKSEGGYAGGKEHGPWTYWLPSGVIDHDRSGLYHEGEKTGPLPGGLAPAKAREDDASTRWDEASRVEAKRLFSIAMQTERALVCKNPRAEAAKIVADHMGRSAASVRSVLVHMGAYGDRERLGHEAEPPDSSSSYPGDGFDHLDPGLPACTHVWTHKEWFEHPNWIRSCEFDLGQYFRGDRFWMVRTCQSCGSEMVFDQEWVELDRFVDGLYSRSCAAAVVQAAVILGAITGFFGRLFGG